MVFGGDKIINAPEYVTSAPWSDDELLSIYSSMAHAYVDRGVDSNTAGLARDAIEAYVDEGRPNVLRTRDSDYISRGELPMQYPILTFVKSLSEELGIPPEV